MQGTEQIRRLDSANRHGFDICTRQRLQHSAHAPYANDRARQFLGLRPPHGADPDVIDARANGLLHMRGGVAAHADDGVRGQQPARLLDGHVCLPEVHARSTDGEGDIDAVVDEQRDIVFVADDLALPRDVDELRRRQSESVFAMKA